MAKEHEMKTLFHLLGENKTETLSKSKINEICINILNDFKTILIDPKIALKINALCLQLYKIEFKQVLIDANIDLDEIEQYSDNQAVWVELLTIIFLAINNLYENKELLEYENVAKNIIKNIKLLDKSLKLRINLYY
ncbi:hypothetical protein SGLAD_v1c05020 [Spiroplasma gladiatoris]|uniref:Uncharacterized protein n=1 Tax=Spiroplasma gladiatoris TaxID=2143 RepID=A0A4P7AHS9_9MOLU|nr:hypothetical protein [Spiroplasma gladiatoris]QBQ07701.1 hypothetical protein SGLAD_v1c05020 [Spiroplasma gladiatoris]